MSVLSLTLSKECLEVIGLSREELVPLFLKWELEIGKDFRGAIVFELALFLMKIS